MANPTHLPVFFVRSVRVRKEHIAGEPAAEGSTNLMKVLERGSQAKIRFEHARDMIVAGTCIEMTGVENQRKIDEEKALIQQERELERKQPTRKAA